MPSCTMCNSEAPNQFPEYQSDVVLQPTGGLHLAIYTGYGMFTDPINDLNYDQLTRIRLCHDCSVNLIDMFPQKFKDKFFTAGHPISICRQHSYEYPNGCHYAWA